MLSISPGVLLWELMSGIDLFQKDLNNDAMVSAEDRSKLACWSDLSHHQLDLVFKPASEQRLITALRRLMAQDLVSVSECPLLLFRDTQVIQTCLCSCVSVARRGLSELVRKPCGVHNKLTVCLTGHPCPQDRPSSMAAILDHPFFLPDEALERGFALPAFRPQMVRTHVMLSYQSTQVTSILVYLQCAVVKIILLQVMHLKRLARLLNAMHISTKDGTMVSAS